ncbi:unnamed protein product [Pylaiella littoralis]
MLDAMAMSSAEYEELYLASVRVPLVLAIFLGLWGFVILVLQALQIDFGSVLRKASGPRLATEDERDADCKGKPSRIPTPPSWRQVVFTAAAFLGVLLACIYGSRMLLVPPTVAVGGFYFILGGALLVPLQAPSVREHTALFFTSLAGVFFPATDVHFAEVLVADALTSLSRVFADVAMTFLLVGKGWGVECPGWMLCYVPCAFMSFPYWVRVRQCVMQLTYEVDGRRRRLLAINVGKYLSAFPVIWLGGYQAMRHYDGARYLPGVGNAIIAAALFNSAYSFAWDVKMDWGLGQTGSRTWGLRNTLLISHEEPWPYYLAVVVDLVLRLSWLLRLKEGRFGHVDMVLTLELVEVLRRSMWNVFRLEWECIQCLGGAKAVRLDKGSDALRV